MKKIFFLIIILVIVTGCNNSFNINYSSNMLKESDQKELKSILEENKLSNVDLFMNLLSDYNKNQNKECGISNWNKTLNLKYDEVNCINTYEKKKTISDGNCRLTAYVLLQDKLHFKSLKNNNGTYLMFDMDVVENNNDYKIIKDNLNEFITLFDEVDTTNLIDDDIDKAFINNWEKYGISIDNDNVSLISFVIYDKESHVVFVGHTGVLIKLEDKYMFIEKIAFELPYQINIIKEKDDLIKLFKSRENYFAGEDEIGPFVYENNRLIHKY